MSKLSVQPYSSDLRTRWDEFVALSKNGTFLIQRGFLEYHSDRFTDASTIVTDSEGRIKALFPASRSGTQMSSHGGLSYGGMISDKTMTAPLALDVFAAWLNYCRHTGISEVVYKSIPAIYHRMPADEDRYAIFYHGGVLYRRDVTSVIDFTAESPVQERRRRGLKKALKAGLHFEEISDIAAFWAARETSPQAEHGYANGEAALINRLAILTTLPDVLPRMAMKGFATDVAPWSTVAMQWAKACQHLITMLHALDDGDQTKADSEFEAAQGWVNRTKSKTVNDRNDQGEELPNSIIPITGDGSFDLFLANATAIYKGQ